MKNFSLLLILAFTTLAACQSPAVPAATTAIPASPTHPPASTFMPAPSPTSTPANLSTSTLPQATPTLIPTPTSTPIPLGVFALQAYTPLVMIYDPVLWVDETDYASNDSSERFQTNSLQAKWLESCQIAIGLPVDFNQPEPWQEVQLGSVKFAVLPFEDSSTGAIYMEKDSISGFDYISGRPMPVISSSTSEWSQCQEIGERALSTLRMPSSNTAPMPYCTDLAKQYIPPDGYRLYCDPQFEHALVYPRNWETKTGVSGPYNRSNPLAILKGQDFFNYEISNDIRVESWQNARTLVDLVERQKNIMGCKNQCFTSPIKLGGKTGYVLIVPSLPQSYDVLFTFFKRGDYFTQLVLMMNTKAGLDAYWQMVQSLQFPGTTPAENEIPAKVIDESYRHVGMIP